MKLVLFICSFVLFAKTDSQKDAMLAYKRFKKSFAKEQIFTFKITKGVFNETTNEVVNKNTVQLFVKGNKLRQESVNDLLVSDGKIQVTINHAVKAMVIKKVVVEPKKSIFDRQFSSNMDSLISWSSNVVFDQDDDLNKYHLFYKVGPFEKIHLAFHKKSGFLQSIAYVPLEKLNSESKKDDKVLIRVAFSDFIVKPVLKDDMFNISAYLRLNEKNQLTPVGICSGYKIVNN
jgi:hypothetical protein